ncbi:preprotein translocase subunit SecD [Thermococcus sp.]
MRRRKKNLLKNWRIMFLTLVLIGSIATLVVRPLTYGIDISGGVALVVETEKPVSSNVMNTVVMSLQNRLNTFGVKDITIEAQGNQIILVKVANVSTAEQAQGIKQVIEQQGVFYMEFLGTVFATGKDVEQVFPYRIEENKWEVPFRISKTAAEKFAELAKGKAGYPVDFFLDVPENSLMVMPKNIYDKMNSTDFNSKAPTAPTLMERVIKAFHITPVVYNNQSADKIIEMGKTLKKDKIVLINVNDKVAKAVEEKATSENLTVRIVTQAKGESENALITRVLGLYGPYAVGSGLAEGVPKQDVQIEGSAPDRISAMQEAHTIATVLQTGSLPVKLKVVGMEFISPRLGENFKNQAVYAGIGALIAVLLIVYLHYRKFKIAIPIASTSLFEVIIILGVASLIKWNLDLPSIAGIIAAIGTGVDQQIVITDELLGGKRESRISKRMGMLRRMGRAFFVILASATTTVVAMSFLLVYFVGSLKGFAVTTILGVLIGIGITRPAYAEIAKYLLAGEK